MHADNTYETPLPQKKRKTEDKVVGCCEQRYENGGTGKKDGGSQKTMKNSIDNQECGDPR